MQGVTSGIQRVVKRAFTHVNSAGHRMGDHITNGVILEKPTCIRL
jgi:hypothetical protein